MLYHKLIFYKLNQINIFSTNYCSVLVSVFISMCLICFLVAERQHELKEQLAKHYTLNIYEGGSKPLERRRKKFFFSTSFQNYNYIIIRRRQNL